MRKIIVALVLIIAIFFVVLRLSELQDTLDTLRRSDLRFLVAAVIIELVWLYNSAVIYRSLYHLVGLKEKSSHLLLVATASNFVNVVASAMGIGGMAVFVDDARKRNHSTGRVTVVGILYILLNYLAFFCLLGLGFIVLIRRNDLNTGEIIASVILLVIAVAVASLLYLGYTSQVKLARVLAWLVRLVNRILRPFIHKDYLQEKMAKTFSKEIAEGVSTLRDRRRRLLWPFLFSLNNFALLICVLAFTFLALGTPFSVGTLVGGLAIGYLFLIVSPTPSGLGIVEGIMTLVLVSLRVDLEPAALITLTYRFITFWLPLGIGAVAFRILGGQSAQKKVEEGN